VLVEEDGEQGVRAISALAAAFMAKGDRMSVSDLRLLRKLFTRELRAAALPLLLPKEGEVLDLKRLDKEVEELLKATWVDWHWEAAAVHKPTDPTTRPPLDPAVRMHPLSPLLAASLRGKAARGCIRMGGAASRHPHVPWFSLKRA
jgi:hypothetical protein